MVTDHKFNELGHPGSLVVMPYFTVSFRDQKWGSLDQCTAELVLLGICHDLGVTLRKIDEWCTKCGDEVVKVESYQPRTGSDESKEFTIRQLHEMEAQGRKKVA